MTRILSFAGSTREQSINKVLARAAAEHATAAGAEVSFLDLRDYPLPLYDGDLEANEGVPAKAVELAKFMDSHDGYLIACPEYNSSITAVLKNTIDWVSRTGGDVGGPGLGAFGGKVIGLLATSPGGLGGIRGLVHVRSIFGNIGAIVVPTQLAIPKGFDVFQDGAVTDERVNGKIAVLVAEVVTTAAKLHGS